MSMANKKKLNRNTYVSRARAPTFSPYERKFIISMANKFSVDENHRVSNAEKTKIWKEITNLFNAEPNHTKRKINQIRKCYDNLKQRQRNEEISQNDSSRLTYEIPDVINKSSNPCQLVNTVESPSQDYNQSLPHIINDDQVFKYVDVVVTEDGQQNLTEEYLSKERGDDDSSYVSSFSYSDAGAQKLPNIMFHKREKHLLEIEVLRQKVELNKVKLLQAKEELTYMRERRKLELLCLCT